MSINDILDCVHKQPYDFQGKRSCRDSYSSRISGLEHRQGFPAIVESMIESSRDSCSFVMPRLRRYMYWVHLIVYLTSL
jgi:hypothetical protein